MGLSSKKTKTKEESKSVQDVSTTPTNPAYVTDALSKFTGGVTDLMGKDPSSFVSPANPLQTQAGAAAAGLGGWQSGLDAATAQAKAASNGVTAPIGASSLLTGLDSYMSPYTQRVVDSTLNDFDVNAGRTRAAQAAAGARNAAFGGSRFGIQEAATEGELARARENADATLRDQAFNTGAALSGQDAARRQEADLANQSAQSADLARQLSGAGLMGQIAEASGAGARDDIATQMGVGDSLRGIDTEQRQAPIGLLGAIGDLLGKGQFGLTQGTNVHGTTEGTGTSTQTSSGSLLGQIGQAVQAAAAAAKLASMSDSRTKTDVETLGHDDKGRRWVSWRYLWEPDHAPRHTGVMAQEIAASDPDAIVLGPMGFLMVDYSKLEGGPWLHS